MRENITLLMDSKEKPYFHLIDGGVADNLGLRAVEEAVDSVGNIWTVLQLAGREKVRKMAFIVVNAETKIESSWDKMEIVPPLSAMLSNYSSIAINRYNRETMAVLQESFSRWAYQIRSGRCPPGQISTEPGSCGDIEFYMVDVSFDNLKDKAERDWMAKLPTSFRLSGEQVDRLRAGARKILTESDDFKRLLRDLGAGSPVKRIFSIRQRREDVMNRAARIISAVVIGLAVSASTGFAEDIQFSGFFGNPSVYDLLKPGPVGGAKLRWIKDGMDPKKYNKFMVDSVIFFLADKSDYKGIDPQEMKDLCDQFNKELVAAFKDKYPDCGRARPGCHADPPCHHQHQAEPARRQRGDVDRSRRAGRQRR